MFDKLKDFFLNKALGRVLVRAAAAGATYLASGALGAPLNVDPQELHALLEVAAQGLISFLKPRKPA